MKNKLLIPVLFFMLTMSVLFVSVPSGLAQTELDWSVPVNLSNSGASTRPLFITGTDDVIQVIWVEDFEGYKYTESTNGVDWTQPVTTQFPFIPENAAPRFEVTENGIIHIFWQDEDNNLFYAQAPQANFGSPGSWRSQARLGVFVVD
jgi:hypothetical protein